ncbi:myosin heavy chain kinase B-like [Saccoglossus kowalevskii]
MTKKEVQSQMAARMLSLNFEKQVPATFGETPSVIPCSLLVHDSNVCMIEEKLKGQFVKYVNNDGHINKTLAITDNGKKFLAFCHYVFEHFKFKLLVTNLQGVGLNLTDIALATWEVMDTDLYQDLYFGCDNMSKTGIVTFSKEHNLCNSYCLLLNLKGIEPLEEEKHDDHNITVDEDSKVSFRSPDKVVMI